MSTLYCYPVVQCGENRFTLHMDEEMLAAHLPTWHDLRAYLTSNFDLVDGIVDLSERSFQSQIWFPRPGVKDSAYVVATAECIPPGYTSELTIPTEVLEEYSIRLWQSLRFSEALAPDECSHLPSEFIRPCFEQTNIGRSVSAAKTHALTIEEVAERKRIVILGGPGAGKTSVARWLAIEASKKAAANPESTPIPVYCRLASVSPGTALWDSILEQMYRGGSVWLSQSLAELSELGKVQFILDGLDEVPDPFQAEVTEQLRRLSRHFPLARMIVTCRPSVYRLISPEFSHFLLMPFNRSQIAEWTFKRLHDRPERSWRIFASYLFSNESMLDMVSNPLLLNIATHVYTRQNVLPADMTLVVQSWLGALLDQWDHVRAVTRSREYWASPRRRYSALCHSAYHVCFHEKMDFERDDFLGWEVSQIDGTDADKTLFSLEAHCGVVRKKDSGKWRFLHTMLLEHCAAAYLVEGTESLHGILESRITNPLWQNIWTQACALSQKSDNLIETVLDHQSLSDVTKCILLLRAFTQRIRCSKQVLNRCADLTQKVIVGLSKNLELKLCSPSAQILWAVKLSTKRSQPHYQSEQIPALIAAAYNSRRSDFGKLLLGNGKKAMLLNVISSAIAFDGEFHFNPASENKFEWDLSVVKPLSLPL